MSKTVLVVDDSRVSRMMLSKMISMADSEWEIVEAEDGQQAVEKASASTPDLIVMDINMPVMDGFQAIEILRPQLPDTTMILLSANIQSSSQARAEELGVHFIAKPITPAVAEKALAIWSQENA
ncbi:response regulator [Oceanospirillum sanctuarii]|uniref:response regulator n=1 Tax=Oceanospirillum sanctuarii TaxID=1434821 RepID=UPI000A399490|nr:response regulator [Oceanospirillum sanctuarii]